MFKGMYVPVFLIPCSTSEDKLLSYKISLVNLAVPKTRLLKTMNATWNYYYNFVYKISSLLGLWPFMKPRTRIIRVTVFTIALFNIFIPQVNLCAFLIRLMQGISCKSYK